MFLKVRAEKRLGNFRLNVDFEMGRDYCVLLGPTGAGKSVFLELIAGIVKPDRGEVRLNGADITPLPPERRGIGFVPQDYALFPHLSVYRNIAYGLRNVERVERDRRVREMAEKLGIAHLLDRKPARLSGGERQRVALARALVIQPRLLLLDEPLSAVDLKTKGVLMEELRFVQREFDVPILHVTHDLIEAAMLADEVAVMLNGRIVEKGKLKELFSAKNGEVAEFLSARNLLLKVSKILD
ncbi:ATP-binding cassette domain-containing protein [Archaeoglobus fulgidus]|jgi:molybdate/tungstate transport system ATP-binding protein|uniref:Molybdate/tungstate import ATP-binding protein WtpC n=2 Tax=Archaeoglobus fulgidus TaxID=2234 RepID=WTPC_ARCFU|nr:ATP-binding cassette domain-containing protein [Archaeoglobus fulgidus]O30144.1 RecName: Full=Molybdate/tungstate import ATP-binding protein WtpC [Archaeoglobus fulgidus DSM 4304]2ONK_A Chain A, Molybdate/tungstate ABC transporter, ATP-binding protein [Archaeoglobus fulgidus]2ONK_B Chain B, Molybdate/tungstate ABC transporter, ATP-binding protein [Archaeoglobus fulgidus]2ONK_F Chain F, Molybdate/tungstate ABC transporter, ATP-binding protein [Archaeoglobus fulgidus]2ONK_G Chain G, Molybdate